MTDYTPPPMPDQPQSPQTGARPAELLDRFLARLIDGVLLGIVFFILTMILTGIIVSGFASRGELYVVGAIVGVLATAANLGYYVFLETTQGATVGKMVMKLKVVGADGSSLPTMQQSIMRNIFLTFNLVAIVPFVGSVLGGLAGLAAVIMIAVTINNDPVKRQGWHDKFASETMVLKLG